MEIDHYFCVTNFSTVSILTNFLGIKANCMLNAIINFLKTQMQHSKEELYNIMTWWHDELTLDERREVKKAWLVCLQNGEVS